MMKKDLQSGRSMIEMLGVLAIIGVLTVGGFSLVSKATTENRINNVIDEVSSLSQRVRNIFRDYVTLEKPTGDTDITEYVYNARAYPNVLEYNASGYFEDDEDVNIKINYTSSNDIHYFILELSNLNEDVCMGIANGKWGSAASNGFIGISFSNSDYKKMLDLAEATEGCEDGATIYLKFK